MQAMSFLKGILIFVLLGFTPLTQGMLRYFLELNNSLWSYFDQTNKSIVLQFCIMAKQM